MSYAPPVVADSAALCAVHSAPSIGPCERCGTFVCDQCGFRHGEHVRCHKCGAPEVEKPPGMPLAALLLAAMGLMCPPLSLAGIVMALIWRYGEHRGPSLGVQYSRWAVIAGVLALLASGAAYYFTFDVLSAVQKDAAEATERGPAKP